MNYFFVLFFLAFQSSLNGAIKFSLDNGTAGSHYYIISGNIFQYSLTYHNHVGETYSGLCSGIIHQEPQAKLILQRQTILFKNFDN